MTDTEFLQTQSRRLRHRIRRSSSALHQELERTIGPLMREHPRTGLAAGTAAGFVLGRTLASSRSTAASSTRRGPLANLLSFTAGTGAFLLRSSIAKSVLPNADEEP